MCVSQKVGGTPGQPVVVQMEAPESKCNFFLYLNPGTLSGGARSPGAPGAIFVKKMDTTSVKK